MEIWKDIEGFEDYYQVSNYGRVKSLERNVLRSNGRPLFIKESILKPRCYSDKHLYVNLCIGRETYNSSVHQLVAKAFIPNPNGYDVVHHKDHNPRNNRVENLEWMPKEKHSAMHKNHKKRVDQINMKTGEIVNSFESASIAADILNYCVILIRRCATNRIPHYKGFLWKRPYMSDELAE